MNTERGFTLIEALVASAVLGLGILGATTLAMHSLNASAASHQQTTALALANNAVECWRSGPTLCPASATLSAGGDSLSSITLGGTVHTVRSQVSPTAYPKLQTIQVTVSWRPTSTIAGTSNDKSMAPGSGQLVITTRNATIPVFVPSPSP